jgi:hypothetical protein
MVLDADKVPHVAELVLFSFAAAYLLFEAIRCARADRNSITHRAWIIYLCTGLECCITLVLNGALFLDQGWTTRSDGVSAQYARWIQLTFCGVITDHFLVYFYLKPGAPKAAMTAVASLIAWSFGIFAVISSGTNMYYWFALSFIAHIFVLIGSTRSACGNLPSNKYWLIPLMRFLVGITLLIVLVLAPSGVDAMNQTTAEWLYMSLNTVLVVFIGAGSAWTYPAAVIENQELINKRNKKRDKNSNNNNSMYNLDVEE